MFTKEEIGRRLKQVRMMCGVGQAKLSREIGLAGQALCMVEQGKRALKFDEAIAIADVLACDVGNLVPVPKRPMPSAAETYEPMGSGT